MPILLIAGLILAWPTFGLSLVAYFAVLFGRGYLERQHARLRHFFNEAMTALKSGKISVPSWANDRLRSAAFIETTFSEATKHGVPSSFIESYFHSEDNKAVLICFIGLVEKLGASIREQGVAATHYVCELWKSRDAVVESKMCNIRGVLSDLTVRCEMISYLNDGFIWDPRDDIAPKIEECIAIARDVCSLTGRDVEVVLTDALQGRAEKLGSPFRRRGQ